MNLSNLYTEGKELYNYVRGDFSNQELRVIRTHRKIPFLPIRRTVRKTASRYINEHCSEGTVVSEIHSKEDIHQVSQLIEQEICEKKTEKKVSKPVTCEACQFHRYMPYSCMNERGTLSTCAMGYMKGEDTRDLCMSGKRYKGCKLGEDNL